MKKETIVLSSFSKEGGPGKVFQALEPELAELGLSVFRSHRVSKSLWESLIRTPKLAISAALDQYLIREPKFSSPISMFRKSSRNLYRKKDKYDLAILGWLPGLLTKEDFERLADTPTIVRIPDENVFTGVCHYSSGCSEFKTGCRSCPAVRKFANQKVPEMLELKIRSYRLLNRKIFVCPSNWIANKAKASLALREEQVVMIRNPISGEYFKGTKPPKKSPKLSVLFVASQVFDPLKGFDKIAERLDTLAKSGVMDVRVIGHSGLKARNFSGLTFLGRLDTKQLAFEYRSAWVTIVPSHSEASGNVVSESLACGTPVLVRNVDGLGEIAEQASPEMLFENDDELFRKLEHFDFKAQHKNFKFMREVASQQKPRIVAQKYLHLLKSL